LRIAGPYDNIHALTIKAKAMPSLLPIRLGVNIDHVATLRNARGGIHPCPVRAALVAADAGADGITAHLREDRRHIRYRDVERLKSEVGLPLNLEMALTTEMLEIACRLKPHACCIVPEKRQELTTEGGLDVLGAENAIAAGVAQLKKEGIRVSLFVDPEARQIHAAHRTGAAVVELHTGTYASVQGAAREHELSRIASGAGVAAGLGLECHAGHGLDFENVAPVAAIAPIVELNIGHFLIGEAVFGGLESTVTKMRRLMDESRGI